MVSEVVDWLNDNSGAVQAALVLALVIVTAIYAKLTHDLAIAGRGQAEASGRIAEGSSRPVILQWNSEVVDTSRPDVVSLTYRNIGNGPAMNLEWGHSTTGKWDRKSKRVGMGTDEDNGQIALLEVPWPPQEITVFVDYDDVFGTRWRSTLLLVPEQLGKETDTPGHWRLTNGEWIVVRLN